MAGFLLTLAFAVAVVTILIGVIVLAGNLLPVATIATAITAVNGYLAVVYGFLPLTMTAILAALGVIFSIEALLILPYKMAKWVWKKIPGIS